MIPYVNIWLYDIEHMDPQKHKEYTGLGNELMLKKLAELASRGASIVVKTPIVPDYTDSMENIAATVRFIRTLGECGQPVSTAALLFFHALKIPRPGRPATGV